MWSGIITQNNDILYLKTPCFFFADKEILLYPKAHNTT